MNTYFTRKWPVFLSQNKQCHTKIFVHYGQVSWVRRKCLHLNVRSRLLYFSNKQRTLPLSNINFINVNRSYFSRNWKIFTFGTVVNTSRNLSWAEWSQRTDRFGFLDKVPFVKSSILARNNDNIRVGSYSWANDRGNDRLHQDNTFFFFFIDFLEKTWLEHSNSCIFVNHNKIITLELRIIFVFLIINMTLD